MNNRNEKIKRFTRTTAIVMLCTTTLDLMSIPTNAADQNHDPTSNSSRVTSKNKSSSNTGSTVASLSNSNNIKNPNDNVESHSSSGLDSNDASSDTSMSSNNPSSNSPSTTNDTAQSSVDASSADSSTVNDFNVVVSFISNQQVVGTTNVLVQDNQQIDVGSYIPGGYHLANTNNANFIAHAGQNNINIPVSLILPNQDTNMNSNSNTNDSSNMNANSSSSSDNNSNDNSSNDNSSNTNSSDASDQSQNSNTAQSTTIPSQSSSTDESRVVTFPKEPHKLPFPNYNKPERKSNIRVKHFKRKSLKNPIIKKQYKHPVKMPPQVRTPKTPKQVNHHRIQHSNISNPMLRPWHNPDRIKNVKDFRSQVKTSKKHIPKNLHRIHGYHNFDKTVLRYRPMLRKITRHYHMRKYDDLILAIMEVESKGQGKDIMQSSESAGLKPNSLNPSQSIEQAVRYMKSITDKAKAMDKVEHQDKRISPNDYHHYAQDNRLLAQSYNYGGGFLDYVSASKYGYSEAMSEQYSKDVVAKQLGNPNGKTYSYQNPIAEMYHKHAMYQNGGNFLYGDEVSQYMMSGYMKQIMQNLIQYRGHPYVFGGKTPQTSFDCSGLVSYGFKTIGLDNFPSFTVTQYHATKPVKNLHKAKPGNLIFFKGTYGNKNFISHVGFLVDRHTMLDSNNNGVEFTSLDQPYWKQHFAGIHKVPYSHQIDKMALLKHDNN